MIWFDSQRLLLVGRKKNVKHIFIAPLHQTNTISRTGFSTQYIYIMDRIRWSERAIPFRSLVDNPVIRKPALGK